MRNRFARLIALTCVLGLGWACRQSQVPTQPTFPNEVEVSPAQPPAKIDPPVNLAEAEIRRNEIGTPTLDDLEAGIEALLAQNPRPTEAETLAALWPDLVKRRQMSRTAGVPYKGMNVTWAELGLILDAPWNFNATKKSRDDAFAETARQWPGPDIDTKADAFRHAYWNIIMSKRISVSWAQAFATAHESETADGPAKRMDLSNNDVGRSLYSLSPKMSERDQSNRLKTFRYEYKTTINKGQTFGYLVYIKK